MHYQNIAVPDWVVTNFRISEQRPTILQFQGILAYKPPKILEIITSVFSSIGSFYNSSTMDRSSVSSQPESPKKTLKSVIVVPNYRQSAGTSNLRRKRSRSPVTTSYSKRRCTLKVSSLSPKLKQSRNTDRIVTIRPARKYSYESSDSSSRRKRKSDGWIYLRPHQIRGYKCEDVPCVFIQNISSFTEKKDIYKCLKYFGDVIDIQFMEIRRKITACVVFRYHSDANSVFDARYRR